LGSETSGGAVFGTSVCQDADTALIGAAQDRVGSVPAGAVYVFRRGGTNWTETARLVSGSPSRYGGFGRSVTLEGDRAVVGADGDSVFEGNRNGEAWVFERTGTAWNRIERLVASDGGDGDQFGKSVALSGDTILIGAEDHSHSGQLEAGAAYVNIGHFAAAATFRNDAGDSNVSAFFATPPELGASWSATVDNTGTGHFLAGVLAYLAPAELYLPLTGDYLLIDPTAPGGELFCLPPAFGYGLVAFSIDVPVDPVLAGTTLSTQGGGLGGSAGTSLYNAYDLRLGY